MNVLYRNVSRMSNVKQLQSADIAVSKRNASLAVIRISF